MRILAVGLALLLAGCGPSKEARANRAVIEAVEAMQAQNPDAYVAALQRVKAYYRADSLPVAELVALKADQDARVTGAELTATYLRVKERTERLRATYGSP